MRILNDMLDMVDVELLECVCPFAVQEQLTSLPLKSSDDHKKMKPPVYLGKDNRGALMKGIGSREALTGFLEV